MRMCQCEIRLKTHNSILPFNGSASWCCHSVFTCFLSLSLLFSLSLYQIDLRQCNNFSRMFRSLKPFCLIVQSIKMLIHGYGYGLLNCSKGGENEAKKRTTLFLFFSFRVMTRMEWIAAQKWNEMVNAKWIDRKLQTHTRPTAHVV